jgi:hypothetical protein
LYFMFYFHSNTAPIGVHCLDLQDLFWENTFRYVNVKVEALRDATAFRKKEV